MKTMDSVHDTYSRSIDYMRISITDRCNLRCIYCMPSNGVRQIEFREVLSYEEITRLVRSAARIGVKNIRLTGGEPLLRRNLPFLVESLSRIEGIENISLTTNGLLLKKYARSLADAGLRRVNISLDSLRPDRYRDITRGGDILDVYEGISMAVQSGLEPVKINMIPIRGINDDEIEDFAALTKHTSYHVRFIEFMPISPRKLWAEDKYVSVAEIKERVSQLEPIAPLKVKKSGPARHYRFGDALGVIGFISPISNHFCNTCNRLRLTCDGRLRPCLFSEKELDIRSAMRTGVTDAEIERLLRLSIEMKPERHSISPEKSFEHVGTMSKIGG